MRLGSRSVFFLFSALFLLFLLLLYYSSSTSIDDDEGETHQFDVAIRKAFRSLDILILMVVDDVDVAENEYSLALNSVRCYAKLHTYDFRIVSTRDFPNCTQSDFMFRRHCVVAQLLPTTEWLLFLDADVAVLNPSILIEQFIDDSFDLTLYDRFVNWEVAAGSYLIRNTQWSAQFLNQFANFEPHLPRSFHGTDNGALHVLLQQILHPHLADSAKICHRIWEQSTNFDTLYTFEACIRGVMGERREFRNVRILRKGTAWVRDIWLTDSEWSPRRDFMVHGLKESNRVRVAQGTLVNLLFTPFNWRSPFTKPINLQHCTKTRPQKWPYNEPLIVSSRRIENHLRRKYAEVERRRWQYMARVSDYI